MKIYFIYVLFTKNVQFNGFVGSFEIVKCKSSNFVLIFLDYFGYSSFF